MTQRPSEYFAILAAVDPQSSSSALSSGYVAVGKFHKYAALVQTGAIASTGTFDAKLQQATDGSGTGLKDITGKAITQLADTADNKQVVINLDPADLDLANGFTYIKLVVTPATAASLTSGLVLGFDPRFAPASDNDAASVVQIVT